MEVGTYLNTIICDDVLRGLGTIPDGVVQTCITSPPYWGLRDYGQEGQLGLESTPEEYVAKLVAVFREVRRVLKDEGTVWLNLGDSYSGSGKGPAGNLGATHNERHLEEKTGGIIPDGLKPKDLVGIPWRVAFALQSDGWYLRQDIIWHKPNPMPESVTDRCTKAHEYIFLLSKSQKYYYDAEPIREPIKPNSGIINGAPLRGEHVKHIGGTKTERREYEDIKGANKRSVWTVNTQPYSGAHFAVFPTKLIDPCILAGSAVGDIVLDPFLGSGTTALRAQNLSRKWIGIELNPEYCKLAEDRLAQEELF